jgi:signal transduction histidine kinase
MRQRRHLHSLAVPITFGAVTVPLSAALLVAWTVLLGRRVAVAPEPGDIWLLVLGAVAFAGIITVLVLFSVFLAREIREVRRQDSFIDSVTHELKSPLASLMLCMDTLDRPNLDDAQKNVLRAMMRADVDRLSCFVDDVLQANRLAHERGPVDHRHVDVADVVARCIVAVSARHTVQPGSIRAQIDTGLSMITDLTALEMIVRNLLDNAVKYSTDVVDVLVSARREGASVLLEVHDKGLGIHVDDLSKIFQRFYRGDDEGVRSRHGTGLGLFVVSCLARNLEGKVTARSEGKGHGATLCVLLPDGAVTG